MPPEYGSGPSSTVEYERARARLTREVNAAVEGALAGGAEEVIVNEAHNGMRNLIAEDLHESVRFITGSDKALGMMQGIDEPGVGAAFFVGYHAKAGTPHAPLAHTWTDSVNDVRLDGRSTGEYGINAAIAGHFGVPVTLVTGDDKAVAQVRDWVGEAVVGVVVKEGYTTFSAIHLHPKRAQAHIREGAEEAVRRAVGAAPWRLPADCGMRCHCLSR
jgi:D-amino peptidase